VELRRWNDFEVGKEISFSHDATWRCYKVKKLTDGEVSLI